MQNIVGIDCSYYMVKSQNSFVRKMFSVVRKTLCIHSDILCKRKVVNGTDSFQIVVNENLMPELLQAYHNKQGHPGVSKSLKVMSDRLFYPGVSIFI